MARLRRHKAKSNGKAYSGKGGIAEYNEMLKDPRVKDLIAAGSLNDRPKKADIIEALNGL
ncbi:hypothetical protein [Pseudemcibacter aquimaris]|uniref:hypothetical protein n=1 Tax=Pseudemcibacter aquimaris TaxID=2857064 RepID=UPI002010E214|nr:hypothetical protein [Pseudemcibacter aquimaris]MCC3859780.1 hypothetical protein [Pseudemcibacter aquimaris]WDU60174.1 hypothetical protein KW060_07875 [Pseudemcibacter aquimaris]